MELEVWNSEPEANVPKECAVCGRQAFGRHYGVTSCDACKMFFRRVNIQCLTYKCKYYNDCFIRYDEPWKCQSCRFQKCIALGMVYRASVEPPPLVINNEKMEMLDSLLRDLVRRDNGRQRKLKTFYSVDDPFLEDILTNPRAMTRIKKTPDLVVSPDEWAFIALYSHINNLLDFGFVQQLSVQDQKIIFKHCTLKLTYFGGLMRTVNEKRSKLLSPGGQEIYPDELITHYRNSPYNLAKVCSEPLTKMIEWSVTDEEYCLLNLIFFCNPAIPDISEKTREILSENQIRYSNALVQLCQLTHQQNAPSRLIDLYSLYDSITNNSSVMENLFIMFHCNTDYKFKKLIRDTFHF